MAQGTDTKPVNTLAALAKYPDRITMEVGANNPIDKNAPPADLYMVFPLATIREDYAEYQKWVATNWNSAVFAGLDLDAKLAKIETGCPGVFKPSEATIQTPLQVALQNILVRQNPDAIPPGTSANGIIKGMALHVQNISTKPELTEKYAAMVDAELAAMRGAKVGSRSRKGAAQDKTGFAVQY